MSMVALGPVQPECRETILVTDPVPSLLRAVRTVLGPSSHPLHRHAREKEDERRADDL